MRSTPQSNVRRTDRQTNDMRSAFCTSTTVHHAVKTEPPKSPYVCNSHGQHDFEMLSAVRFCSYTARSTIGLYSDSYAFVLRAAEVGYSCLSSECVVPQVQRSFMGQCLSLTKLKLLLVAMLIGRIHEATVAAIFAAIVAATVAPCIHYTLQATVAAIVAVTIAATIAPTGCGDARPVLYAP